MSPLRMRVIEDMTLAGLAPGTQMIYIQSVRRLAAHCWRPPDYEDGVATSASCRSCSTTPASSPPPSSPIAQSDPGVSAKPHDVLSLSAYGSNPSVWCVLAVTGRAIFSPPIPQWRG